MKRPICGLCIGRHESNGRSSDFRTEGEYRPCRGVGDRDMVVKGFKGVRKHIFSIHQHKIWNGKGSDIESTRIRVRNKAS